MDADRAINYYSICLPLDTKASVGASDEDSQGVICNNLGYLYTQTKNLEFAERYLKQAIALKNPDALYNLGYLYESSWSYDSSKRRTKEGYDLYCQVLYEKYTSDSSKERAREKLTKAADRLLARKNYAAALQYYKAIGDGTRAAECIRNIKRIRQLYEERKKRQMGAQPHAAAKAQAKPAAKPVAKPAPAPTPVNTEEPKGE
jgi:tetratricopeptide (TPR) repeat protein